MRHQLGGRTVVFWNVPKHGTLVLFDIMRWSWPNLSERTASQTSGMCLKSNHFRYILLLPSECQLCSRTDLALSPPPRTHGHAGQSAQSLGTRLTICGGAGVRQGSRVWRLLERAGPMSWDVPKSSNNVCRMPGRQEHIEATLVCDVAENESTQSGPWTMSFGKKIFLIFLFIFLPYHAPGGILVPWPGMESSLLAVKAESLNHWTTRELPGKIFKAFRK